MSKRVVRSRPRWTLLIVAVWAVGVFSLEPSKGISPYLAGDAGTQTEEHEESSSSSSQMQAQQGSLVPSLFERTYVSVSAAAFQPKCQDTRYGQYGYGLESFGEGEECADVRGLGTYWGVEAYTGFVAGVQLPHGWTVASMEIVYILDEHRRRGVRCMLYSVDTRYRGRGLSEGDLMAICYGDEHASEVSGWWARRATTEIWNNPQVDNSRYSYYIHWAMLPADIDRGRLSALPICVIIGLARQVQATAP